MTLTARLATALALALPVCIYNVEDCGCGVAWFTGGKIHYLLRLKARNVLPKNLVRREHFLHIFVYNSIELNPPTTPTGFRLRRFCYHQQLQMTIIPRCQCIRVASPCYSFML